MSSESNDSNDESDESDELFKLILAGDTEGVQKRVLSGDNALTVGRYDDMVLHFATLNRKIEILKVFADQLKNQPAINTVHVKDADQCGTALHVAMDGQVSIETASFLLEWGADVNAHDLRGGTVIHELIDQAWDDFEGHFSLEGYMETNPQGGASYLEKLGILKRHGVDINGWHSLTGLTPLHKWCQQFVWCTERCLEDNSVPQWVFDFFDKMIEFGCDPKLTNERGESPLFYLAQRQYKENHKGFMESYSILCKRLVEISSLDQKNNNDHLILHAAAEFSNIVLMCEILKHKLDVNARDKFGLTPTHIITHNITTDERGLVTGVLGLLRNHGADLDATDNHGSTPLHHSVHIKNLEALDYLLVHGANVHIKDENGLDVLDLAAIDGNQEIKDRLGLMYQRSQTPIVTGVSDVRIGYFYPNCCHGNREDICDEQQEIIEETQIPDYLSSFSPCVHNRKLIIQNSLPVYEENKKQCEMAMRDSVQIQEEIMLIMNRTAAAISEENPSFACDVILGGSNAEGTKVGSPDEFDFVFILRQFSKFVIPEEGGELKGFMKIKSKEDIDLSSLPDRIIDDEGYVRRSELSNGFHKLFEKCLRRKAIFENTGFASHSGTVNSEGECWDIGQLSLLWYGPFQKRQSVKIDIVPALQIPDWQTQFADTNINILDSKTLKSLGCFLVMKDCRQQYASMATLDMESNDVISGDDQLFRISFSQIEHAVMFHLPNVIKEGVKLAKTMPIQCPKIACSRVVANDKGRCDQVIRTDKGLLFVTSVFDYISSYKIKTALFHILRDENFQLDLTKDQLVPSVWNSMVVDSRKTKLKKGNIEEALKWSAKIYHKMLRLSKSHGDIPDFFLPVKQQCTGDENEDGNLLTMYSQIMLHLCEKFEVPADIL